MKKIILILLLLLPSTISAKEISAKFSKCIDGDTAEFLVNDTKITTRFLAVDTPETKHPTKGKEPFGQEASDYTCHKITNAKNIILEYDEASDELDKYNRHLVWIYVDDSLLQEELITKGLAKVAYLYGDYKYTEKLKQQEKIAQENKIGIWSEYIDYTSYYIIGSILLLIIIAIILTKVKNKTAKKTISKINTKTKNNLLKLLKKL